MNKIRKDYPNDIPIKSPVFRDCRSARRRTVRAQSLNTARTVFLCMFPFFCASWSQTVPADSLDRPALAPERPKREPADSVLVSFSDSLAAARAAGERDIEARHMKNIGSLLLKGKKYREAEKILIPGLRLAEKIGAKNELKDITGLLAELYAERDNYPAALEYLRRHSALKDTLTEESARRRMAAMEAEYMAEKMKSEESLIQKENDLKRSVIFRQRTTAVSAVGGGLLAGAMVLVFFRGRRREKRMNRELKDADESLARLSRLNKGLTGMITHDFKNHLNGILVHSEKANDRPGRAVRQSAKQMLNMVNDLLDIRKFEEGGIRPTSRDALLRIPAEQAVEEVKFLADEKGVSIHNDVVSTLAASMDSEIVRRIFVNLLTNAVKLSDPGGEVWMKAIAGGDGVIRVSVNDSGEGIAPDQRERIFEKFGLIASRQSGKVRSTGLGLTYCKLAVESLGGILSVESEPGKGSSFAFTLAKAGVPPEGA